MTNKMKKIFWLIPALLLSLFFLRPANINASDVVKVTSANKIGDYYFTNDNTIIFTTIQQSLNEAFLEYRVVQPKSLDPNGKLLATDWIVDVHMDIPGKDAGGTLFKAEVPITISFDKLNYDHPYEGTLEFDADNTYYVEIKYYKGLYLGFGNPFAKTYLSGHDQTLKIVREKSNPTLNVEADKIGKKVSVEVQTGSIVEKVKYVYIDSFDTLVSTPEGFEQLYNGGTHKGEIIPQTTDHGNEFIFDLPDSYNTDKYLLIYVEDGNDNYSIVMKNIDTGVVVEGPSGRIGAEDGSGLLDNKYSQYILIILLIVLVVTASLIVAQKMSDRKKRVY